MGNEGRNEKTMNLFCLLAVALNWIVLGVACWLGWHLLRQNGHILLRLEELGRGLEEPQFEEAVGARASAKAEATHETRAARFGNPSLARSRIKRGGLKAGTRAPNFSLPRLDGSNLSLEDFREGRILLVFSDPHCGPCNALAPELEKFHREDPSVQLVMISRGEPKENRVKVKKHDLTFPVVLQRQWEISRLYAMFATPMAYMIDEQGIIMNDVAVGVEPILTLMTNAKQPAQHAAPHTLAREKITPISSFSVTQ